MTEIVTQHAEPKRRHVSRVGNGSKLLPATDGRSLTARRFKDLIEDITADLGGRDMLSEGQRQLIRRASMLSAESERLEALWARGESEFDIDRYAVLTNALGRVFDRIGLARVPRNVTRTLAAYLQERATAPMTIEGSPNAD